VIYIHNAILHTSAGILEQGAILIAGETISAIGPDRDLKCPPKAQRLDANGLTLVPGFIDLQMNGAFGMDFTANPETIWQVGEVLPRFGVTSFLPTIVSAPPEAIVNAQTVLKNGPPFGYRGARAIGLHLEGPYLNPEKCGAHQADYLCLPQPEIYEHWNPASFVRMVTVSPELPGALLAIQTLAKHGVVVGAGHSQANLEQSVEGINAGITYGTHLFNAMPQINHRQPGLPGALLMDKRTVCGLIVDGCHLHPLMVAIAWQILGSQRTSLVTDSVAAMGMPAGEYQLGEQKVFTDGTTVRLANGVLAGSLLSLDQALRNLVKFTGCSLEAAIPTVTQVPARLLQLDATLGKIAIGAKADLVLLTDALQVSAVWVNGQQVPTGHIRS
jgi:N-acetylglucosamine-6-phosphate deacetylase